MVETIIGVSIFLVMIFGIAMFFISVEEPELVKELLLNLVKPNKDHKITRRWVKDGKYWWECECKEEDWDTNPIYSWMDFVEHRSIMREEVVIEDREGWFKWKP